MSRAIAVGIFTVSALIILAAGVFIIGQRKMLFGKSYVVISEFPNVAGLDPGAEVRVGGLRKGTVKEIRLPKTPDRQMTVVMSLDTEIRPLIRRDSIASIETEGLLGNKYVSISFGSNNAAPLGNGESIRSQAPMDYPDLLKKTNTVIEQTGVALQEATTALQTVNRIGNRVESVATKIDKGQGTIGALVNDRTLYNQADQILKDARETTSTVKAAAQDLSRKTSDITDEARNAVADIRHTTSTIAKNADPVIEEARQGLENFNENMEALKHNWFFRGFFKKRGYFDLAKLTEHEINSMPSNPSKRIVLPVKDVFDEPGTADLNKKKQLNKIGRQLEQNPGATVVVSAYADQEGTAEENLELTRAQAGAVRRYLVENFRIDEKRIFSKGFGESATIDGVPSRRVEITIYPAAAEAPTPAAAQ